jgi:6-phosphofructokinase 2
MLTITLNPALDISATVSVIEPDRKMHCTDIAFAPGGGGVNVARVAHRLGAKVTAAVFLASGSDQRFEELLDREGIAIEVLEASGALRESMTFVETSTGRQYRFVLPGPAMDADHFGAGLTRIESLVADQSHVVVSGSLPPGCDPSDMAKLVALAAQHASFVFADVPGHALAAVSASGATLMKPSVRELSNFATTALVTHTEIETAARSLIELGSAVGVIVSLGEAGALLVHRSATTRWFHAPRVQVLSTVGAGDSLVAGVATALARGEDLETAVRFGIAAGTAATIHPGTNLCQPHDVERLVPQVLVTGIAS